jgi:DNA-binding CsgD family transcriptional regulator/DNA-binding Lrp family transcriptional regulator
LALTTEITSRKDRGGRSAAAGPPLIGRRDLLDTLGRRQPPATVLLGEMGAGKSRLLTEARLRNPSGRVFSVACQRGAALLPFDPLMTLVAMLHRAGFLTSALRDAAAGASERDRLSYIREALESAVRETVTFQIDDLQWADDQTPDALRYCIDRLQDLPVKWQIASRQGDRAAEELAFSLRRAGLADVLIVEAFTFDELREFANAASTGSNIDDASLTQLYERTGGNPLYAELLLAHGSDGAQDIPRTLRWALHERLRVLSSEARDIAGWLAVQRSPLPQGAVAALAGYSPAQVLTALTELVDRGIARRTHDGYSFRHELLRDVCYETLDETSRAKRHEALAARTEDEWQRAGHFDGARRYDEAAALLVRIGWDRLDRDAPSESLAAFQRAAQRVDPESLVAWEARAGIASATFALGDHVEARNLMAEFEERAAGLPGRLRVLARCRYAEAAWTSALDLGSAVPALEAAIAEAPEMAQDALPRLLTVLGAACERRGDLHRAQETLERGLRQCAGNGHVREEIRLRSILGVVRGRLGNAHEGIRLVEEAAERAAALGLANELAKCSAMLCYLCEMIADFSRHEYWCRRGLDVPGPKARRTQALLMNNLAKIAVDRGRLQEALGLSLAAAAAVEKSSSVAIQALCAQANLYAMLGDFESAARAIGEARVERLSPAWQRAVEFSAGFVAEFGEKYHDAIAAYRRAIRTDGQIGEVYELRALAGVVRVSLNVGFKSEAEEALERLRATNRHGWPVARQVIREAEGNWKLMRGDVGGGCDDLLDAAAASSDRFWQAYLRLIVADARGDRELFIEVIDAFDALGAASAADRARSLARAHGLRPGRKREARGNLSEREISVALLVASGKTNAEIAELLHVSRRTVEYHLTNVMGKCSLRSRVEIALRVAAGTLLSGSDASSTTA